MGSFLFEDSIKTEINLTIAELPAASENGRKEKLTIKQILE